VRLCVLGSGGIEPDPQRSGPAYLVDSGRLKILLDLGPGALRQLARAGTPADGVSVLCLTHRHPDHHAELWLLLQLLRTHGRRQALSLLAPEIFAEYLEFFAGWGRDHRVELPFNLDRHWMPGSRRFTGVHISGRLVPHVAGSVGYRLEGNGRVLVFTGDCGPGEEVVRLAAGADLLLCECSLPPGARSAAHLAPEQAAEIAARAGARRLVLTHLPPHADPEQILPACRDRGVEAVLASDLEWFEV